MESAKYASYLNWKSIASFSGLNYLQAGVSFLISTLIATYLGKEQFGYYSYGLIFLTSLMTLSSFGMDKSLVRDLVQIKDKKATFLLSATALKLVLAGTLALGVVLWALLSLDDSVKQLVVIACALTAVLLSISPKQWYDWSGWIHRHALITLGERLLFLTGVVLSILFVDSEPIIWVVFALLSSKLIMLIVEWKGISNQIKINIEGLSKNFKPIIKNNVWIWFAAIGNMLMLQFNQFILEDSNGLAQLALFGMAFQMIQLITLLQGQILRLASPGIAEVTEQFNRKNISNQLLKTSFIVLGASIALVLPFYFLAPYFIIHIVGVDFEDAVPVFNILLIWVLLYGIALINNQFLISLHLQRPYFVIAFVFGLASVGLAYYLVGMYGAVGAALSLLIAHSCSIIAQMLLVWRHLHKHDKAPSIYSK